MNMKVIAAIVSTFIITAALFEVLPVTAMSPNAEWFIENQIDCK